MSIKDTAKRPTIQITLNPAQYKVFFEKRERYAELVRERFKDRDLLKISCETLASDNSGYLQTVQTNFCIQPQSLPVNDLKKELRELKDIINNYDELYRFFVNTKWSSYFE
ncbi:hypothetical protein [Paraglaciecola psychrophila]|uniref:hypothetical protein n=1 Tax=Paraglaciecola psychrophila TaxID=326544 RepID=UPI001D040A09|nr:hypothetical protein [Paraglaciecola psychrophila]